MSAESGFRTVLQDETGAYSTARCAFWTTLLFALWVVYVDVKAILAATLTTKAIETAVGLGAARVAVYGFLSGVLVAEIVWAAGSKGINSIAPAIASAGQVFSAIAAATAVRVTGAAARTTTIVTPPEEGPPESQKVPDA